MSYQILLVKRRDPVSEILTTYLMLSGYRVQQAQTPAEALAHLTNARVDIGIIDAQLPGLDGFTLCLEVRQQQELPIILLTDMFATTSDRAQATLAGADTILTTPFELKQVDHELTRILPAQESSVHAAACANPALFATCVYEPW